MPWQGWSVVSAPEARAPGLRGGGEDVQQLPRQIDHALVTALRLVYGPEAVEELVELLEIALGEPMAPRNAQVVGVGGERGECGVGTVFASARSRRQASEVAARGLAARAKSESRAAARRRTP